MDAWYLKYRSQSIEELDLTSVRVSLERVLASGKVPQALLFTGPRGTGKTSAARILAKALNCEKNEEGKPLSEPCNKCSVCVSITNGSNVDVLEIDAASNRGIDDVRELRERVKLAPSGGKYRVYIIDEVHMLTGEAFNALLKTIEEPPKHAVFILCTTEGQRVPETIVSRCTRIIFERATSEEIGQKLERVAKGEKLTLENGVIEILAESAKGSFRDAIKFLEQVAVGQGDKKISLDETHDLLGHAKGVEAGAILGYLKKKDAEGALGEVAKLTSLGGNVKSYLEELVEVLRVELLIGVGVAGVKRSWEPLGLTNGEIDLLIRAMSRAYAELKDAVLQQIPLELAVVEWCGQAESRGEGQTKQNVSSGAPGVEDKKDEVKLVAQAKPQEKTGGEDVPMVARNKEELVDISLERVAEHWADIMRVVKPKNHSVEALLKASRPLSISGGFLNLEVYYKFHKERLETEKCRSIVEEAVGQVMGVPLKIRYSLGQRAAGSPPDSVVVQKDDVSGKEVEDEIVKAAAEIFKGTVVE